MPAEGLWSAVGEALDGHGWRWRVVPVECLADAAARVSHAIEIGQLPDDYPSELKEAARVELPSEVSPARSLVVGALARRSPRRRSRPTARSARSSCRRTARATTNCRGVSRRWSPVRSRRTAP